MEAIIYSTFMKSTRSNPNGQVELEGNTKKASVSASVTNSREVSVRLKWRCKILIQIIEHGNYRHSPILNDALAFMFKLCKYSLFNLACTSQLQQLHK